MAKQKKKTIAPPRKVGDILITEAVVVRRKWAKQPPVHSKLTLFPDGTSGVQSGGITEALPAAPDRSEARTAAEGGDSLFQSYGHCCDRSGKDGLPVETDRVLRPEDVGEVIGQEYRVRPCRCRKWFCEWCGPRQGIRLRQRLLARLASFTDIFGITLTVDGSLFESPEQTWLYVMGDKFVNRLVRDLNRGGHLHTGSYFWVVEFQSETEQPHWHLLVDAARVPHGAIVEIWSRFRPQSAERLPERITAENYKGQAPSFGSVWFTAHSDKEKAAFYATKYLTKHPLSGYPDWVLDRWGKMPRHGHSHRFFPRVSGHDPMCFCAECRSEEEPAPKRKPVQQSGHAKPIRKASVPTSIRQRLEACGNSCTLLHVDRVQLPDGTVMDGRGCFVAKLGMSFRRACELLGVSSDGQWQIELSSEEAAELEEISRREESGEAA